MKGNVDGVNNDYVAGWMLDPEDADHRPEVDVLYNGRLLTRTRAAFPRADVLKAGQGDGRNGFFVALPALDAAETAQIVVREAANGQPLGEPVQLSRHPACSRTGVLASDILRRQAYPLNSVQQVVFNGEHLQVFGAHHPPGGNPFALRVTSSPGTVFDVEHPISSPNVGGWYWYWPNATWSGYAISVDIAATTDTEPYFEFAFGIDPECDPGTRTEPAAGIEDFGRNRLWVPKDLATYQNFPSGDQLTRVQGFESAGRVAVAGFSDHMRLRLLAEHYGIDLASARVLDWGCGHGRVLRHFAGHEPVGEAWGVDVDPENVGWLLDNVAGVQGGSVPLMPPMDLPDDHFDFIYAISVMTHLTLEAQGAWLRELHRVGRPGAIVALSFSGESAIAYASRFLTPDYLERLEESGFDESQVNNDLDGKIGDDGYYRNTRQLPERTRELWGEHLEVLAVHPCLFGYQDVAVMRVPD